MLDENLLITASRAARGITAAQAAVDEAKRLVEEAKLGVETAKSGLADAKAAYDAVISEIAGSGVSASKARKAVEDMLRIFADVGIIDASADDAPAEPKAPRRKKAEAAPAVVESPAASVSTEEQSDETATPAADATEAVETVESKQPAEAVVETVVATEAAIVAAGTPAAEISAPEVAEDVKYDVSDIVETAVMVEASSEAVAEIDNQEALREIFDVIESSTVAEDLFVSETLISMLNAAEWYSREHRGEPLSLELYREILNVEFVSQALGTPDLPEEVKGGLEAVAEAQVSENVFEWFLYSLGLIEDGKSHPGYAEFFSPVAEAAPAAAADEAPVEVEDIADEDVLTGSDDFIADPEADEADVDVSDDETLAVDVELVGEDVTDIEEINFLEPDAAVADPVKVEAPAEKTVETPVSDAPAAGPRRFTRPAFVPKKS